MLRRINPYWHIKALTPALAYQAYWIIDCASRIFYEFFFIFLADSKPAPNVDIRLFAGRVHF